MYKHTFDQLDEFNKYFSQYKSPLIHYTKKGQWYKRRTELFRMIFEKRQFLLYTGQIDSYYRIVFNRIRTEDG
jgi:hypothetical protein